MRIQLPFSRKELVNGKVITTPGTISAIVDMSVNAEEKWEKHFPDLAAKETVFAYAARISEKIKTDANTIPLVLSSIKALYCFLESDELPDFKSFARLFDLTDDAMIKEQLGVLETAFGIVNDSSVVDTKN